MTVEQNRAFELEYKTPINVDALRDDVISYLGEYRFKLPTYDYSFFYSRSDNGAFRLRDKYDGDLMTAKAERAIRRNEQTNRSTNREEAELLGLQSLEQQLEHADDGDLVVWASPPGPKEEGYGNYGFFYIGSVEQISVEEKKISMTAVRIEEPSYELFNYFLSFATSQSIGFKTDVDFLANPFVLNKPHTNAKKNLFDVFNFKTNTDTQKKFTETIEALSPFINELIRLTLEGAIIDERKQALNVLENLTAGMYKSINNDFSGIKSVIQTLDTSAAKIRFGHKPEIVAGSCGASGSSNDILSNNIFNNSQSSLKDVLSNDHFDDYECPHCHKTLSGESKTNKSSWRSKCDHCGGNIHC